MKHGDVPQLLVCPEACQRKRASCTPPRGGRGLGLTVFRKSDTETGEHFPRHPFYFGTHLFVDAAQEAQNGSPALRANVLVLGER